MDVKNDCTEWDQYMFKPIEETEGGRNIITASKVAQITHRHSWLNAECMKIDTLDNPLNISEMANNLQIYPNPAKNNVII